MVEADVDEERGCQEGGAVKLRDCLRERVLLGQGEGIGMLDLGSIRTGCV